MMNLRTFAAMGVIGTSLMSLPAGASSVPSAAVAPASASGQTAAAPNWTTEQLVTATVHDAWLLSGKNEATFFEMVTQLADLSAKNRGVTLPDDEATGRRMGEYIKRTAKLDTDQLLYAVVDKAVVFTTKAPVHAAGAKR